ncbi:MAG: hypothetical protein ACTTJ3_04815 [Treponema sp.]
MIDKSLSMATKGKFDSLCKWLKDEFIDNILIYQDNIVFMKIQKNY